MRLIPFLRPFFERHEHRVLFRSRKSMLCYGEIWKEAEKKKQVLENHNVRGPLMVIHPNSKEWLIDVLAGLMAKREVIPISSRAVVSLVKKRIAEFKPAVVSSSEGLVFTDFSSKPIRDGRITLLTSGSSGGGSSISLRQENIVANLKQIDRVVPESMIGAEDSSLSILPWSHSYGMTCELLFLLTRGASLNLPLSLETVAIDLRRTRPTLLFAVPVVLDKILRPILPFSRLPLRSVLFGHAVFGGQLRAVSVGGARSDPNTLQQFEDMFDVPVYEGYGMTECSPMIALNTSSARRLGSVGRVLPGIDVRIEETTNEIVVRGENVVDSLPSHRYLILDGCRYMRTGDRGKIDADGYLFLQDRISDHFKLSNGIFIHPQHVEDVYQKHRPIGISHWVLLPDTSGMSTLLVGLMTGDLPIPILTPEEARKIGVQAGLLGREIPSRILYLTKTEAAPFLTEKYTPRRGLLLAYINNPP